MKTTVDTNVLVSATFWGGDSDRIIRMAEEGGIELVLSQEIIEEFSRVLQYEEIQDKIKERNIEMKRTIESVVFFSTIVEPLEKVRMVEDDPDDDKILDCAKSGKVDYIISNDKHLLKLKEFEKMRIVSPK